MRAVLSTEDMTPFYAGYRISGEFLCRELATVVYYDGQENEYVSDGAAVALVPQKDTVPRLLEDGTHSLAARIADLRGALRHQLTKNARGEAGELLSALLLGTKEHLQPETVRHFRRVGLSHLLALSGLHLAILAGAVNKFLSWLQCRRQARVVLISLFCFLYLLLTGFSFSTLRAVAMLLVTYAAFLCSGDYDGLTSLCVGAAAILLWQPGAVTDLSYQMTVLATLGILSFGDIQGRLLALLPRRRGPLGLPMGLLRHVVASLSLTLFATLAILPVQWLTFGEIALLTPLSNLLLVTLAAPTLVAGLVLLVCTAFPFAPQLGAAVGLLPRLMLLLTERLATLGGVLSLGRPFVPFILVPMLLLTVLLLLVRLRHRFLVLAPTVAAVIAFAVCFPVADHLAKGHLDVAYRRAGSSEALVLAQGGEVILCDLSGGSKTQMYEGYQLAKSLGAADIDVLMLTHYHSKHARALNSLCETVPVRALWAPAPTTEKDTAALIELLDVAIREGIAVTVYAHDAELTVFDTGTLTLSAPLYEGRSVEPALRLTLSFGGQSLCYQSAAYSEYARHAGVEGLTAAECLILGSHGPIPHEPILPAMLGIPAQVVLADEDDLPHFDPPWDTRYILAPARMTVRLS